MADPMANDSTPYPDWYFDDVLPNGSGVELKVTSVVIRHSIGQGHRAVKLSLPYLVSVTGENTSVVKKAIKQMLQRGFVTRRQADAEAIYQVADIDAWAAQFRIVDEIFDPRNS